MKKGIESYMHRYAKQTLATWLRKRSRVGLNFKGLQPILPFLPLHDKSPMFGVYEEYPICMEQANGQIIGMVEGDWKEKFPRIPSYYDLCKYNEKMPQNCLHFLWFFDVAVINPESGKIHFVCEIVHKNPLEDKKIAWLNSYNIPWIEIKAEWILNCVSQPFSIAQGILRSNLKELNNNIKEKV